LTHKVILVAPGDRQLAETLIAAGADVTTAGSLEALQVSGSAARMLIVDVRDQSGIPAAVSSIRRSHPSLGIVLIASKPDPAMMLDAIRTGVNELLTEPINVEDVRAALDRMASRSASQSTKSGKTYAFLGAKGGVGTTTVAVNVATALSHAKAGRVLLIDLHPAHGDAALFLGAEPRFSIIDALENTHRMDAAFFKGLVEHTKAGVDLLASSDRLLVAPVDTQRVRALLEFVARTYDHVVVDAPRSDSAMLDALESAAIIVIVANQELSTVRGAARMAATLRQRYGRERVQIVVSRYDTVSEIGQEDIERATGGAVRHLFPSNYRLAINALNKGQPLVIENHNKLSASFVGFARSLAGMAKRPQTEEPKSGGFFGRLTGKH
jgi:pilus assembly protein CpaE